MEYKVNLSHIRIYSLPLRLLHSSTLPRNSILALLLFANATYPIFHSHNSAFIPNSRLLHKRRASSCQRVICVTPPRLLGAGWSWQSLKGLGSLEKVYNIASFSSSSIGIPLVYLWEMIEGGNKDRRSGQ
jgi:hypothetical protein